MNDVKRNSPQEFLRDPKNRLIFALDVPTQKEAIPLVRELKKDVRVFKVGTELFLENGWGIVDAIANEGKNEEVRVFLDLKFLDIPQSMRRALDNIQNKPDNVIFATIHWFNGGVQKTLVNFADLKFHVLLVTLLTSMDQQDLNDLGLDLSVDSYVMHQAGKARDLNCGGVIASGREAKNLKMAFGKEFLVVTPGIRPAGSPHDDQKRVATPREAIINGADFLVVGRPIKNSPDGPLKAAKRIQAEILLALEDKAKMAGPHAVLKSDRISATA